MQLLGNIKIGVKLGMGFGAVTAILIALVSYQIKEGKSLYQLQSAIAKRAADSLELKEIDARLRSLYAIAADAVINRNLAQARSDFNAFRDAAKKDMERVGALAEAPDDKRAAAAFVSAYGDYLSLLDKDFLAYLEAGGEDMTKVRSVDAKIDASRDGAVKSLGSILASLRQESERLQQGYAQRQQEGDRTALVLTASGVALSVLCAVVMTMLITRPLKRTVAFAMDVTKGVIDNDLPIRQMDEVGEMAWAMRRVTECLRNVLSAFEGTAKAIATGRLLERGDASKFQGAFARLIAGGNELADEFVRFLDFMPQPVMAIDREHTILYINPVGAKVGGKSQQQLIGRKCFDHFKTDDCNTPQCACRRAMDILAQQSSETKARPGEREMDIYYSAVPIQDAAGAAIGAMELVTDLTAIKSAERRMQTLAQQAEGISVSLSKAAEQLSSQVEESSQGAEVQKERSAETATAMEQMNATVLEVAKNASNAAEFADGARDKARQGATVVEAAIGAIGEVKARADTLRQAMTALGEKAQGIGAIMNVISDIADQTNLLALNAAIEAARAGEAGRGFAVVADEVRKLAEKTMSATSEVGGVIGAIQAMTRTNITETEDAARAVAKATDLATSSGAALTEILSMAEGTADKVRSIATASEEQSATSEEINRATEEVNRISSETTQTMVQAASAVRDLAGLAQQLNGLIEQMTNGQEASAKALAA